MPHSRREFLRKAAVLWAAAALRAHEHQHANSAAEVTLYKFAFLDGQQRRTLRTLMDRIVPADNRSSGALGASVDEYIDFILAHADTPLQETWHKGLNRYGEAVSGGAPRTLINFWRNKLAMSSPQQPRTKRFSFF